MESKEEAHLLWKKGEWGEDFSAEMRVALVELLEEAQAMDGNNNAMSKVNPARWCEIAGHLMLGRSLTGVQKEMGVRWEALKRIHGQVFTSREAAKFRRERAMQIATQTVMEAELQHRIVENLLDDSAESLERIRTMGPRELQALSMSQTKAHETFDRVTGNNKQTIEVRHVDATPKNVMELINALPEAQVDEVVELEG